MKGCKVFNPDWTCRGFQYEVGKTYEIEEEPVICEKGFHFCAKAADCFNYYKFDPQNKVAEVEATGEIVTSGDKSCTNKITIVREISWEEVLTLVNTGNWNTGDWNTGDYSSGVFCTKDATILMFDEPTDWTLYDWWHSDACALLRQIPRSVTEWVIFAEMSDAEKTEYPDAKTTGGYLKVLDESENAQMWWNDLSDADKQIIYDLPNFNKGKFEKCVGIKI